MMKALHQSKIRKKRPRNTDMSNENPNYSINQREEHRPNIPVNILIQAKDK